MIIISNGKYSLGSGFKSIQLKEGQNEVDEREFDLVRDKWFMKSLLASGAIAIKEAKEVPEPAVDPASLVEVVFGKDEMPAVLPESEHELAVVAEESFKAFKKKSVAADKVGKKPKINR